MQKQAEIETILSDGVAQLGYEWVGIEWVSGLVGGHVRVYADKPSGITIGDLSIIDKHLRTVLAVESKTASFTLEVSSPGLDRILFNLDQCKRFVGKEVVARLSEADKTRKTIRGVLTEVTSESVVILEQEQELAVTLHFSRIERLRLIPELPIAQAKK